MFLKTVGNIARSVGGGLLDEARDTLGKLKDPIGTVKSSVMEKFADPEEVRKKKLARFQAILDGKVEPTLSERRELESMGLLQSGGRRRLNSLIDFFRGDDG